MLSWQCSEIRKDFPGGSVVKNPLSNTGATETPFQSLGLEDPLEQEMATHSNILANIRANPMDRGSWQATVCRVAKS